MEKRGKKDKEIRLSIQKSQYVNNRSSRKRKQIKSEMEDRNDHRKTKFPQNKRIYFQTERT